MPKDIDIVVFLQHECFKQSLLRLRAIQAKFNGAIDCYFEPFYPESHRLGEVSLILKNDWQQLYSHTRRHPITLKIHQKGFLQINPNSIF